MIDNKHDLLKLLGRIRGEFSVAKSKIKSCWRSFNTRKLLEKEPANNHGDGSEQSDKGPFRARNVKPHEGRYRKFQQKEKLYVVTQALNRKF